MASINLNINGSVSMALQLRWYRNLWLALEIIESWRQQNESGLYGGGYLENTSIMLSNQPSFAIMAS
jgi:hypothetical protein